MNLLKQRLSRKHYAASAGLYVAIMAMIYVFVPDAGSASTLVWLILYGWRLHDFDRSAWWGVLVVALSFLIMFHTIVWVSSPVIETGLIAAVIVANFAFTVWLCFVPGDQGANRYGYPNGFKQPRASPMDVT